MQTLDLRMLDGTLKEYLALFRNRGYSVVLATLLKRQYMYMFVVLC